MAEEGDATNNTHGRLWREYGRIRPEIDDAIERALHRGWFVLGQEVEAFEAEWAAYCGTAHAVGMGNSTTPVHLALRVAGVGAGDEVVIPALSAASTAVGVAMAGATPVFAGVDPEYCTLDAAALAAAITAADLGYAPGSCPNAEELTAEVLSLPLFPQLTAAEVEQVIRLVRVFFAMH